jgi:hypothetical protein
MFPSLSQGTPPAQGKQEPHPAKEPQKDELLELGALLAFLKLAFG